MDSIKKWVLEKSDLAIVQFLRYSVVGGIATVVDFLIFYVLASVLEFNHLVCNTLSFTFGLIINYFLSSKWVFNVKTSSQAKDFAVFSAIGIVGLVLTNVFLYLLVDLGVINRIFHFLSDDLSLILSKMITVVIVLFWNFTARKKLVFKESTI